MGPPAPLAPDTRSGASDSERESAEDRSRSDERSARKRTTTIQVFSVDPPAIERAALLTLPIGGATFGDEPTRKRLEPRKS